LKQQRNEKSVGATLNSKQIFAQLDTRHFYELPARDLRLNPHEPVAHPAANPKPLLALKGTKQYCTGGTICGMIDSEGSLFVSPKVDQPLADFTEKNWAKTNIKATQISTTHNFVIVLQPDGTVTMVTLVPIMCP
jgi:hypothetical protein